MARITTYQQIKDMREAGDISDAEWLLVENCRAGEPTVLNGGNRPELRSPECGVQAELLRYLILGGCEACEVDALGVRLRGAYIHGKLDLSMCQTRGVILLSDSVFEEMFEAVQATMMQLNLRGSLLQRGGNLSSAVVSGGVYLTTPDSRAAFECHAGFKLIGARINGQFAANGGQFHNDTGVALHGQSCVVDGPVFLTDGFAAKGEVNFDGAKVGNLWIKDAHLSCAQPLKDRNGWGLNAQNVEVTGNLLLGSGAQVIGGVRVSGAEVSGKLEVLDCQIEGLDRPNLQTDRAAFEAGRAKAQSIHWKVDQVKGKVSFSGASCDTLNDKLDSWELRGWERAVSYNLDGFVYDHLARVSEIEQRLSWADHSVARDEEFSPQPLSQLAKVLRGMGYESDARQALVKKERRVGVARRQRLVQEPSRRLLRPWRVGVAAGLWSWDRLVDALVGYGYYPQKALLWLTGLIFAASLLFGHTYERGYFAPNSPVLLISPDWKPLAALPRCIEGADEFSEGKRLCVDNPAAVWSAADAVGRDYETFSSLAYATDVVIPIINLGQESAWAPSTTRGIKGHLDLGWWSWWLRWVFAMLGWVVTALGAAAITGIIRRD